MFNIMRKMKVFSFGPSAVFALGVIIGVLTLAKPAMAQTPTSFNSGWFWQNPWPQPDNLHSVVTPNTQTIVAVGALGRFIMSTDGGATWTVQSLGNYDLLSISCSDANTCTAVGNDNSGTLGIILLPGQFGPRAIILARLASPALTLIPARWQAAATTFCGPRMAGSLGTSSPWDLRYLFLVSPAMISTPARSWQEEVLATAIFCGPQTAGPRGQRCTQISAVPL